MIINNNRIISVHIDKQKLLQTITVLPILLLVMLAFVDTVARNAKSANISAQPPVTGLEPVITPAETYPLSGTELNTSLFSIRLPPPPLDALPYDVREPLSNGTSVPVKKRWLWIPPGQQIVVSQANDNSTKVDIPVGALWWKEFYIETDRGTFLIERRIIARVAQTTRNPEGWVYYASHHLPSDIRSDALLIIESVSDETAAYMFQPHQWLPTQQENTHIEVRFEDTRGIQYPYVFPGQTQCAACHNGAAGAYPNGDSEPIFVFGLHPNNLTPESFTAMVQRGWITGGDSLLTLGYPNGEASNTDRVPLDALTQQIIGVLRNNCASCHNSSTSAAAYFTAFQIDPNAHYNTQELIQLLGVKGLMAGDAFPLVTPGELNQSEIWLRINGLERRRRMPPLEGGLPEVDPKFIRLIEQWITQLNES